MKLSKTDMTSDSNHKLMGARVRGDVPRVCWNLLRNFIGFCSVFFSKKTAQNLEEKMAGGAVMGQFPELCYSSLLQPFVDKTGMAASWPVRNRPKGAKG